MVTVLSESGLSVGPGLYHGDPTPCEVVHVPRCDRCPQGVGDRRDLAVGVVDGMSSGAAHGSYHGVGLGGGEGVVDSAEAV